jgi:dTDP-4-amino-4,6-dideoxygalactose transaminase
VTSSAEIIQERSTVPFFDPGPSFSVLKSTLVDEISELIDSGAFINGPQVAAFETAFADFCGADHCVGVASGLDALRLALIAGGLAPGDEVIVPANTFVATLEAVTQAGGVPVLVDVSERDWNIDPEAVEAALTDRTRFLMPVHLYGQMADMRTLREIAARAGIGIIEDACQAHGAERDGLRAGASGLAAGFSFYPAKNLGAMGDAGALVTTDAELAAISRALREHGQTRKYHHALEGFTARLDTIQAIVLLHKLRQLDRWTAERRAAADGYSEALDGVGDLVLPAVAEGSEPVWHLYVVCTQEPERMAEFLDERGVKTGRHYPEPAHLSPAYTGLGYGRGSFPVTEQLAGGLLSLPIFPGISESQIAGVVDAVTEYFA